MTSNIPIHRSGPRSLLLGCLVIVAGCQRVAPPVAAPAATDPTPIPSRPTTPFLNADPLVAFVGSQQCTKCHADQHATWTSTAHARSMSKVLPANEPPDARFDHDKSGRHYEVARVGKRMHHRESLVLDDGTHVTLSDHPVDYLIGSGRFSRTYLVELDGHLVESPVTWYASRKSWDMSPGYDYLIHDSFRRRATRGCLLCHAGLVERREPHGFTFPHNELSIGCERCHGPGSLHVEHHRKSTSPANPADNRDIDHTIVNPKHLSRALAEAVCQQCHLQADVKVIVRGRRPGDFRPGHSLVDERIEYQLTGTGPEMTVVGHVDQLHQSRCYQQAGALSCVTCHDPHDPHQPRTDSDEATYQRRICLDCHRAKACGENPDRRRETAPIADACTICHMPRVATDIPHIAFTHHRIAVHATAGDTSPEAKPGHEPDFTADGKLITSQDLSGFSKPERDRMLGLAYFRLHFQRPWRHAKFLARADRLLDRAAKRVRGDATLTAARAEIAWESRRREQAEQLADRVLGGPSTTNDRILAARVKARALIERQDFTGAIEMLKEITAKRRDPLFWALLGHCCARSERLDQAIAAFEKALVIAPGQGALHAALVPLYKRIGDQSKADDHNRQARQFPAGGFQQRQPDRQRSKPATP
ncbi:MAG: tetratricopeptide repeat protein [Planctomycetaceae bacterium]